MAAADDLAELLHERVDLRAAELDVGGVDEPGMQAQPAQQRERTQDGEAVARDVAEQAQYRLALPLQVPLVEAAMARAELDLQHLLLLGREVGGHLLLGAALDQGRDPPPQPAQELGVGVLLDRPRVLLAEAGRMREEPGCGDRQQ